jgi:UDP-N-acetylglucosamine--N-acetylmuramyl-(pentapeptide) pyrophosphoryl-undecaprenol N-acetylglucosamine transferase
VQEEAMKSSTKIILSGGGTAGHIYPALALADELRSRQIELHYVGTATGPEAALAHAANIDFTALSTAGFDRSRPLTLLSSSIKALKGVLQARKLLKREKPSAVVCFGGYVSVPVGLAASLCKIPLIIHEQNSHMGMTNRSLAKRACFIALSYPKTAGVPREVELRPGTQVEFVGNPVRESVLHSNAARARTELGIPAEAKMLLIFGGSRGARKINQATLAAAGELLGAIPDLYLIHGAGKSEYDAVKIGLDAGLFTTEPKLKERYQLVPYIENMGDVLAASDLVVARAGATSIAELTALGKASVLVPYPYATDDHQTTNAQALVDLGGARLISDSQLTVNASGTDEAKASLFADTLLELMSNEELRATMAAASAALAKPDAAARLADATLRCADSGREQS